MRYESSVTSLSWIPSEAVTGSMRVAFDSGIGHYDDPPPAELGDLDGPAGSGPVPVRQRAAGLDRGRRRRADHRRAATPAAA